MTRRIKGGHSNITYWTIMKEVVYLDTRNYAQESEVVHGERHRYEHSKNKGNVMTREALRCVKRDDDNKNKMFDMLRLREREDGNKNNPSKRQNGKNEIFNNKHENRFLQTKIRMRRHCVIDILPRKTGTRNNRKIMHLAGIRESLHAVLPARTNIPLSLNTQTQ